MSNNKCRFYGIPAFMMLMSGNALAINHDYAKQLERSGCTEVSVSDGCDVHKSRKENQRYLMGHEKNQEVSGVTNLKGKWLAKGPTGGLVAEINVDANSHVTVNGSHVAARVEDGALTFHKGFIRYTIRGDKNLPNEDSWYDSDAESSGPIYKVK